MSRFFGLAVLILLMFLMLRLPESAANVDAPLSMLLGFLLLAGFLLGKLGNLVGLPGITGYLVAGVLFGPSCFEVLDRDAVGSLRLINSFALTLIALTAGGEVDLRRIRRSLSSFLWILGGNTVVAFAGVMACMTVYLWLVPSALVVSELAPVLAVSMLFAVVGIAKSPSSTVAVIVETGARGRMTEMILGITIIKDLVVILVFAVVLSLAGGVIGGEPSVGGGAAGMFLSLGWEIGGSILLGLVLGLVIILYMRHVGMETTIFIIAISFISSEAAHQLHLHSLLACMTAGLVVSNLSSRGHDFIGAIEKGSLPLYVVFFAIAGADINLSVLAENMGMVVVLVASRLLFTWLGTWGGAALAGETEKVRDNMWMGFLTQAGVTLGIAMIVADRFPAWGTEFKNVVIGSIAVFQIAGPVVFKYGLQRAGEIPGHSRKKQQEQATAS